MTVLAVLLTLFGLGGEFWTVTGEVTGTYWAQFWGALLLMCVGAGLGGRRKASAWLLPAVVPFVLLLLWQGLVVGFGVPKGIFTSVTDVWASLRATFPVLLRDAYAAAGGSHPDLAEYDRAMAADRRTVVLLTPERFATNPPGAEHVEPADRLVQTDNAAPVEEVHR